MILRACERPRFIQTLAALQRQRSEGTPEGHPDTAVYYANRAACFLGLELYEDVVKDCGSSLEIDPGYTKALMRRGRAFEALSKPREALADFKAAEELKSGLVQQRDLLRLEKEAQGQEEQEKTEMMGKLKDLGNSLLGRSPARI